MLPAAAFAPASASRSSIGNASLIRSVPECTPAEERTFSSAAAAATSSFAAVIHAADSSTTAIVRPAAALDASAVRASSSIGVVVSMNGHVSPRRAPSSSSSSAAIALQSALPTLSVALQELRDAHGRFHSVASTTVAYLRQRVSAASSSSHNSSGNSGSNHAISSLEQILSLGDSAIRAVSEVCRREEVTAAHAAARARSAQFAAQAENAAAALRVAQEQAEEARRLAAAAQEQEKATQAEMEALTSFMDSSHNELRIPATCSQVSSLINSAPLSSHAKASNMSDAGRGAPVPTQSGAPPVSMQLSPYDVRRSSASRLAAAAATTATAAAGAATTAAVSPAKSIGSEKSEPPPPSPLASSRPPIHHLDPLAAAAAVAVKVSSRGIQTQAARGELKEDDDNDDEEEKMSTPSIRRPSVGLRDWLLALDGPADAFPCGNISGCERSAEAIREGRQEICCYVRIRKQGVGHQIRVHYKGCSARNNEWCSAKALRQYDRANVDAFIEKHRDNLWVVSMSGVGHPTMEGAADDDAAMEGTAAAADALQPDTTSSHFTRKRSASTLKSSTAASAAKHIESHPHLDKKPRGPRRLAAKSSLLSPSVDDDVEPLGPFGAVGNQRALEDSEIDKLMQQISNSKPLPVPSVYLATCSVERWVDVHEEELRMHLAKVAVSSVQSSEAVVAPPPPPPAAATANVNVTEVGASSERKHTIESMPIDGMLYAAFVYVSSYNHQQIHFLCSCDEFTNFLALKLEIKGCTTFLFAK
jgi:hypothetical protein